MLQHIHYRARLKLYHPSQQECKTRCCDDSDTGTEGYSSDGEEVKSNIISLDRSDSLVIHDVPETVKIDKKKGEIDSSHQPAEQSSSNAVHSLLQSIRDETEKYLVTQEGTLILASQMLYSFSFITVPYYAIYMIDSYHSVYADANYLMFLGSSDGGKSPSLIHSDILDKLETLERLMVAATHTGQGKR